MRARTAILRAGLTGNIAAGKSTVAGWMAELGCHVLDADRLAHECLAAGEPTYDVVLAAFADRREVILRPDGEIDRAALGRIVFADDAARYHRMIVVTAPDDVRLRRLQATGLDPDEARRRMASQMSQDEKAARADYVVDNGGTLAATRQITETLVAHLREDLATLRAGTPLEPARPLD
jgi:dephospho-CoA kinase